MKKLLSTTLAGMVLALCLVPGSGVRALAQTTTPTPPPVQGPKLNVVMYVDTVQGAAGNPAPTVGCSQTNLFRRGQQVVFRMWGVNVKLGGVALTPKNVKSAVVTIPGQPDIPMNYGAHGKAPNPVVSFWSAAWTTTTATPLGVVNFSVVVKTKADKKHKVKAMTATYTQAGFSPSSQLTVTP